MGKEKRPRTNVISLLKDAIEEFSQQARLFVLAKAF
jgi:hypothetical protein